MLRERTYQHEILDDHTPEQAVVDKIYAFLGGVNRYLGGTRATITRFEAFSQTWSAGERIEVLDVASGGADLARALVAWGRHRGFDVRATAVDVSVSALDYARRSGHRDHRLRLVCADAWRAPCRPEAFDYVTSALFFHHLTDEQIVKTLRSFERLASHGIVVNDLVRSQRAYLWTWLLTRPFHPILAHDGPLSVRRALRPPEMQALAAQAELPWLTVQQHFGHRMTLAGQKPNQRRTSS